MDTPTKEQLINEFNDKFTYKAIGYSNKLQSDAEPIFEWFYSKLSSQQAEIERLREKVLMLDKVLNENHAHAQKQWEEQRDTIERLENVILESETFKQLEESKATIERLEELLIDKEILLEAAKNGCDQRDSTIERQSKLLEKASWLVGNPGTNISSSADIACDNWQKEYTSMKSQQTHFNSTL